jgi:DNA-binding CsgD family transcriptional regulator
MLWARRQLAAWQATDCCFAGCAGLDDIVDRIRHGPIDESRQLCWALLDLVAAGEDLAVRVLLQAMIPGLVSEMARWLVDAARSPSARYALDGTMEAEQILVTEATQAIADLAATRPRWPIADLLSRAHRLTLRQIRAERAWTAHNVILADVADTHARRHSSSPDRPDVTSRSVEVGFSAAEQLAGVLARHVRAGTITPMEGQMVWLTRSAGYRPTDIARRYGLSADTFRRRRHRIEARLADAADRVA